MTKKQKLARYITLLSFVFLVFLLYICRLVDWQIVNGQKYLELANRSNIFISKTDALRGEILDVNGVPFAENETGYNVVFDRYAMNEENENALILSLIQLFKQKNAAWIDALPIYVSQAGRFEFASDQSEKIEELKGKTRLNLNSYATADDCMDRIIQKLHIDESDKYKLHDIASVKYGMLSKGYYQAINTSYVFAENISQELVSAICENYQEEKGIRISLSSTRKIANPDVAPHIVGFSGKMSEEQLEKFKDKGYTIEDIVGKSGIELVMEDYLRGKSGEKKIELSREGEVVNVLQTKNAEPGKSIFLTIDQRIQKAANESLKKYVRSAQSIAHDCKSGAVVALDVRDFSILAAASYPGYDLERYVNDRAYYNEVSKDRAIPLYNRAFNGSFAPGSVFKPIVAIGALEENAMTETDKVSCNGLFVYPGSNFTTKCLGHHGHVDFKYGLTKSCNVYFCEMGRRLGIKNMNLYCRKFGLGQKTGIELTETAGVLAGPEHSKSIGMIWSDKVTTKAAIGQSDNLFSPVQLATYVATIANGGNRYRTHLIRKITDYKRNEVILENDPEKPELMEGTGVSEQTLDTVKSAMRQVALAGTARDFSNYPFTVAAKTGTAQNNGSDHVTFICFAPYEKPEIAIAVVIEHGAKGFASKGVARDVLDAYFATKN
ncbi:MAG: penicillin-binding protein [Clostridia bacterium]|nr:penicillin-binding protein [Clostridia bacterium]